jgi:hypothetical protein
MRWAGHVTRMVQARYEHKFVTYEPLRRYTGAICKVRELAAVHRCYAEGGGDCYAKL